ncbi:MAG: RNA polymerase sigma factor [Actinomycetota bacterium]
MDERNLKRLVRNTARGDEQAAGELFDLYHARIYRYALAKLWDKQAAEDVASETFARVLRDLDRFKWRGAGFEAWLFRMASNLVTDQARSRQRELPHEDPEFAETTELRTPEWAAIAGETTRELNGMLAVLPTDQREVLVLRFAGGLETEEIGAVMGRKANAVRQLQFRALEQLRDRMRDGAEI